MSPIRTTPRLLATLGVLAALFALVLPLRAFAQEAEDPIARSNEAAQLREQRAVALRMKREAIWDEARARMHDAREFAELTRRAKRGDRRAIRALKVRKADDEGRVIVADDLPRVTDAFGTRPVTPLASQAVPTNVRANSVATDGTNAGQSETNIAGIGNQLVAAWNDGQGFNTGGDVQGYAWSNDGGATWTDGGDVLHPPGFPAWKWTSDPVMTVNEKTGYFYYCGLANSDASNNAIGVARGKFTAGVFAFDSVFVVRTVPNTTTFLDKQWIAADSSNNNVYVTNTTFTSTDQIDFYRSTDGGRTWSSAQTLSSNPDAGYVQGSRVAVGPNGEVHAVWYGADPATDEDNVRYRRSVDGGVTFAAEVPIVKFNQQFGTGAPGFNRERGVNFPSIAVDRSNGPHRGRVYVGWQECYHFLDDALPTPVTSAISKFESTETTTGTNDTPATATPFTVGQVLRGSLTTKGGVRDNDYFSFPLSAGQAIIVYMDSVTASRGFTLRVFAPDGVQRLCYAGKPDSTSSSVGNVWYTFMAPTSGTYYLRMTAVNYRSATYRIRTRFGVVGTERGRDQRDMFALYSDDGTTFSTPTRLNDDAVGFDNFLSEIAVGSDGMPYGTWFDHRDDTYGTRTYVYMTRSADGGATWVANQRIADAQSNFTTAGTNIAPNHGDYAAIASTGTRIAAAWGDGRSTTTAGVDVWTAGTPITSSIATCPNDTTMTSASSAAFGWTIANQNTIFGGDYSVSWSTQRNWPKPANAAVTVGAGSSAFYSNTLVVPDTAASGVQNVCLTVTGPGGVVVGQCCFRLTVVAGQLAVGDGRSGLSLAAAAPNPAVHTARIAYSLPRDGRMTLRVYDLAGARIRTLVDGSRSAGPGSVIWDGRDEAGNVVRAGAYFYRLEFEGRSLTQRMVLMH